ncbi:heat shock factor 2-binding protein-like [Cotesia glomerata]|nr:heat shock factor 2-binding protein-like [Cotesia glomerata]
MEEDLKKIGKNFDVIEDNIEKAKNNIEIFLEDLPKLILDPVLNEHIDTLRLRFYQMVQTNNSLIDTFLQRLRETEDKLAKMEASYGDLFLKHQKEQQTIANFEEEVTQLVAQTDEQSKYCTELGATAFSLLWTTSKYPQNLNCWLTDRQDKVAKAISIANTTFSSYIETFSPNYPPLKNDITEFAMSVLGFIANLTSIGEGRQFLLKLSDGRDLINQLIQAIPSLVGEIGQSVVQLILLILYNVSLNREGLAYLLELKVYENVVKFFDDCFPQEVREKALRILQSLTYELLNYRVLESLVKSLPMGKLSDLAAGTDNLAVIAQSIVININNSRAAGDTCSYVSSSDRTTVTILYYEVYVDVRVEENKIFEKAGGILYGTGTAG